MTPRMKVPNRAVFLFLMNFLAQKLTIDADDATFDAIMQEVVKICKKVEPDCTIKL